MWRMLRTILVQVKRSFYLYLYKYKYPVQVPGTVVQYLYCSAEGRSRGRANRKTASNNTNVTPRLPIGTGWGARCERHAISATLYVRTCTLSSTGPTYRTEYSTLYCRILTIVSISRSSMRSKHSSPYSSTTRIYFGSTIVSSSCPLKTHILAIKLSII